MMIFILLLSASILYGLIVTLSNAYIDYQVDGVRRIVNENRQMIQENRRIINEVLISNEKMKQRLLEINEQQYKANRRLNELVTNL